MGSVSAINTYLEAHHTDALTLVTRGVHAPTLSLERACDMIYTLCLTEQAHRLTSEGAKAFGQYVKSWSLAGGITGAAPGSPQANVHLTAYVLGALNLLRESGTPVVEPLFAPSGWNMAQLVDDTNLPRWPKKFSHHSWRVSHWVGGAASIIYNLWRLAPEQAAREHVPAPSDVLVAADRLVNARNGLLKCYSSELAQRLFKALYKIRHDPEAGEVGGIVHLHWVNYATGRVPYKAAEHLFDRARKLYWKAPFLEKTPYCLDFDIVQILRTSAAGNLTDPRILSRAKRFIEDIDLFFETSLDDAYALHKLPGALATQHEAALILGLETFGSSDVKPIDIIKKAGWI